MLPIMLALLFSLHGVTVTVLRVCDSYYDFFTVLYQSTRDVPIV